MVRKRLPSFIFPPNPGLPGLSDFEFVFKSVGANLIAAAQLHDSLIKIQAVTSGRQNRFLVKIGNRYAAQGCRPLHASYREDTATRLSFVVLLKLASEMSKLQGPTSHEVVCAKT